MIIVTDTQLGLFCNAKTWYIDWTFKIVNVPFYQLLTVHGFMKSGDEMKQVPLMFVMISGKRKQDYRKVWVIL